MAVSSHHRRSSIGAVAIEISSGFESLTTARVARSYHPSAILAAEGF